MSLKEILTTWNEAIIYFENGKFEEAIDKFRQIVDPSAKILFNIGVTYLAAATPHHDQALKWFSDAITKDPFLAVAYFQRGCTYLKLQRYREAGVDFQSTLEKMRGSSLIDYRQLGLPIKLYTSQVLMNLALVLQNQSDTQGVCKCVHDASRLVKDPQHEPVVVTALSSLPTPCLSLLEFPIKELVFRPAKSLVANLQKKDFLGQAKVVSSMSRHDKFVGFEGARKCHSNPASPNPSRKSDHLSVDNVKAMKGSLTPPPPTRPPPVLPPTAIRDFNNKFLQTSSGQNGHVRSSSGERSRPIPPSRAPPVLKNGTASVKKDKPPRPPPPVLKRKV
ncbi:neutrophil cytosol factor 2-like [Haliotis rufescens]|uniref:neutrophil cytosol factor 2-like n=1 Tax=Haliotis rufescens TaxID=6454 RepID=UPI00201E7ACD|nr:neutrophil cytosol factor 2-like [Haliotis rufescens]